MPRPVDTREAPAGCELVAVPVSSVESAGEWRLEAGKPCRRRTGGRTCGAPSVAALKRTHHYPAGNGGLTRRPFPVWWPYCPDHLYGKWIEGGQVMCWILREKGSEDG